MGETLPFKMAPAPVVRRAAEPVDLGEYDERYAGWKIVVDLGADLETNDVLASVADESAPIRERNRGLAEWLARMLVAWNFVDDAGEPLPQPREGGAARCRQELIPAISKAVGAALAPKAD